MNLIWQLLLLIGLPMILAELSSLAPWLAEQLLRVAARLLPEDQRSRYVEEWLGELDVVPGQLFKLVFAVRIALRAPGTRQGFQGGGSVWVALARPLLALGAVVIAMSPATLRQRKKRKKRKPKKRKAREMPPTTQLQLFQPIQERNVEFYEHGIDYFEIPIRILSLSSNTAFSLERADITSVGALLEHSTAELLRLDHFDQKSLAEVRRGLDRVFGMDVRVHITGDN